MLDLLRGARVVEVSRTVAAAYAGRLLADLGAEVARPATPIVADVAAAARPALAASLHQGKDEFDPDALAARVEAADVLVCDDGGRRGREGQVVVEIGAGVSDGKLHWSGTNLTAAAAGAMSWVIGDPDREPLTLPFDLADYQAGANAAAAAALGLLLVAEGRPAPRVEVSTAAVVAYYTGMIAANFVPYERAWHREGRRNAASGGFYPSALFRCRDGDVAIMCRVLHEWEALVRALGSPAWTAEPRFADPREIARHHADEADRHISAWTAERTRAEVLEAARRFGFPAAPILTVAEALEEEQFAVRGFLRRLDRDCRPPLRAPGCPFAVSSGPHRGARPRPRPQALPAAGPLAGIRVLDLSWVWSGPMVASVLADLGAEVIKVEHGTRPDPARVRGPAIRDGRPVEGPENEASPYFNQVNHGKRSVAIDLRSPEGPELVARLAEVSDVLIENMRPGALARRGLGYEELAARNGSLVYLSMSIAGHGGPLSDLKGYAPVMSGMAGLESLLGYGSGEVVGMLTTAFGDPNAASHALAALFAALRRREVSGRGAWIDLSQIEALMAVMHGPIAATEVLGRPPEPPADSHAALAPHGHFPCAGEDRWIAIAVAAESHWHALCRLAGLGPRRRALDAEARLAARAELEAEIAAWTRGQDRDALAAELGAVGVPAAPVRSFEEMRASELGASGGGEVPHPYIGSQFTFFVPWRIDGRIHAAASRAPFLGEHTREDLARLLALGEDELDRLEARGAISTLAGVAEVDSGGHA